MKGKTFLILLVAAGVLVTLTFIQLSDDKHTGDVKMGDKLFADLPVNQIGTIVIADSENTATLIKGGNKWQVEERSGYPADFDELRDMVVKLSRLKIGRSFTGSPESLKRLSLLAPSAVEETGRGTQITLKDRSGKVLVDIILGQARETDGGGSGGQYLKKVDGDTIFLVDGNFRFLKSAPAEWLQKEILNIKADAVAAVTCYADDTQEPVYTLSRPNREETANLIPVPPGRSVDQAKVEQVFDALAPLTMDDVTASDAKPPVDGPGLTRLVYRLYDGRQVTIFPSSAGGAYTLRVAAEDMAEAVIAADAPEPVAENSDEAAKAAEPDTKAPTDRTAAQLNEELGAWEFSVQKWQFDSFITQPDALLEVLKKEGEGAS